METEINQVEQPGDVLYRVPTGPKKRVLFVITQSELGGAQQFLARLIGRLDKNRFSCSVVAGAEGKNTLKELLPEYVACHTARYLKRNPSVVDDIASIFELRSIFLREKPDVIFLNSSKAGFNGSIAARMLVARLPTTTVIYRIGGWAFNDPRPAWQKLFFRLLEKITARWKDYIVVNNRHDHTLAQRYRITPRREVVTIHNGIDPYMPLLEREEARIKLSEIVAHSGQGRNDQAAFLRAPFLIGVVANFYPTKGLKYLIDALAHVHTDMLTIMIGDGQLHVDLVHQIKNLGLEKKIVLAGRVKNAYRYLKAFDALVLPSVKEGFPWILLEAMAAKVPVIATRVGAVPELIESGRNGLIVPPANTRELTNAIERLANDERMRDQMALEAHQDILRNFDIHQMVERYERLLNS